MRILVVDDEAPVLSSLVRLLGEEHHATACAGGAEALARLRDEPFDLILTDLRMTPPDGFAVLRSARALTPAPAVVVLTGMDTAAAALEAMRLGALDYLVKPVETRDLLAMIARATDATGYRSDMEYGIVGRSPAIHDLRRLVPLLARSSEAVLLIGETGTGKDLVARAIHAHGPRAGGPFIAHNMAATPAELAESVFFGHVRGAFSGATGDHAGLFEQAAGGTLFLDEVDSFPLQLQAKLLRALESREIQRIGSAIERRVDVRIIAASATDLRRRATDGQFRADLYYRLGQLEVLISPLRDRLEDVSPLAQHFLDEFVAETGRSLSLSAAAIVTLRGHAWPGNGRELRHAVRSAALLAGGGAILPVHLPRALHAEARDGAATGSGTLRDLEREHIRRTLERTAGNLSLAARLLGIDRGTLARKLRGFRVHVPNP